MSILTTIQYKAALWILDAFYTLQTGEIKALASLILIYLHLKKLAKQSCFKTAILSSYHILIFLLSTRNLKSTCSYPQSLAFLNDT